MTNIRPFVSLLGAAALLLAASARAQMSYGQGVALLDKYHCSGCHALDRTTSGGPSLRAIARHYASEPNAVEELELRVHNGSVGIFGPLVMPAMNVPHDDLEAMIKWILKLPLQP